MNYYHLKAPINLIRELNSLKSEVKDSVAQQEIDATIRVLCTHLHKQVKDEIAKPAEDTQIYKIRKNLNSMRDVYDGTRASEEVKNIMGGIVDLVNDDNAGERIPEYNDLVKRGIKYLETLVSGCQECAEGQKRRRTESSELPVEGESKVNGQQDLASESFSTVTQFIKKPMDDQEKDSPSKDDKEPKETKGLDLFRTIFGTALNPDMSKEEKQEVITKCFTSTMGDQIGKVISEAKTEGKTDDKTEKVISEAKTEGQTTDKPDDSTAQVFPFMKDCFGSGGLDIKVKISNEPEPKPVKLKYNDMLQIVADYAGAKAVCNDDDEFGNILDGVIQGIRISDVEINDQLIQQFLEVERTEQIRKEIEEYATGETFHNILVSNTMPKQERLQLIKCRIVSFLRSANAALAS